MSLFFESSKPTRSERTIEKWRAHSKKMRKLLEGKDAACRAIRNESRKLRFEASVDKSWDLYLNNVKLHDRIYEIGVLIAFAEDMLPRIAKEKTLLEEEKFLTETLSQKCDTWIGACMDGLSILDKKLEKELTRNDEGIEETKKEIELLEEAKNNLKNDSVLAWKMVCRLEEVENKLELNLEFKKEVLKLDKRCQAIEKMDTGVSFKVEPLKGPAKMLTIEEWSEAVYGLVDKGQSEIQASMKLREAMAASRGVTLNEYNIQFDKTDYAMRKRTYEINREKNESQYQLMKVNQMMEATKAEWKRLELFLKEVKDDLRCAETRCSDRFFRPSVDATLDPPFTGMNKEVVNLQNKVEEIEAQLDALKAFYNQLEEDALKFFLETESKNKSLQVQAQALDIRIAGRYDPKKMFAYNPKILMSKMVAQMPPPFSLYSTKY